MRKALSLIIVFVVACICGCSKGPKPIYHYVADAIKRDFNFKSGTYWIMRDSISGRIDSFCVTGNYHYTEQTNQGGRNNPAEYREYASVYILDYNTSTSSNADTQTWAYHFVESSVSLVYRVEFYARDYPMGEILYGPFDYPNSDSFFFQNRYDSTDTVEINNFRAYQINGHSFTGVTVMHQCASYLKFDSNIHVPPYGHEHKYNDLLYVCPKIGIVKMRLNHPQDSLYQVWEIQRWNIKM